MGNTPVSIAVCNQKAVLKNQPSPFCLPAISTTPCNGTCWLSAATITNNRSTINLTASQKILSFEIRNLSKLLDCEYKIYHITSALNMHNMHIEGTIKSSVDQQSKKKVHTTSEKQPCSPRHTLSRNDPRQNRVRHDPEHSLRSPSPRSTYRAYRPLQ